MNGGAGRNFRVAVATCLAIACVALSASGPAGATLIRVGHAIDFHANQSFWGPDRSSADFRSDGRVGTSNIGVSYQARASTGNVTADYDGSLAVFVENHNPTSMTIGFSGDPSGGSVDTFLGAHFRADAFFRFRVPIFGTISARGNLLDLNYSLATDTSFTPSLGQRITGASDPLTLASPRVGFGVVSAGVAANLHQDLSFVPVAIRGNLVRTLRGTSLIDTEPFTLSGNSLTLALNPFPAEGMWDLTLTDLRLDNAFLTGFDLSLDPFLRLDLPGHRFDRTFDFTAASFNLYDTPSFGLNFGEHDNLLTISVKVTEPPIYMLVLLGLLALLSQRAAGTARPALRKAR